jgi:hypothetical protein
MLLFALNKFILYSDRRFCSWLSIIPGSNCNCANTGAKSNNAPWRASCSSVELLREILKAGDFGGMEGGDSGKEAPAGEVSMDSFLVSSVKLGIGGRVGDCN